MRFRYSWALSEKGDPESYFDLRSLALFCQLTPISKPIATGSISSKIITSLQKELHTTKTELETVKTGLETTKTDTKAIVTNGRELVRLTVEYACDQTDYNANVSTFPYTTSKAKIPCSKQE
ncbi:hypothetical protein EG327_010542 [Venturia inaequalis]|uniref:Uncharacterized protein n=1 Tax=Venturia inaequalis TaxID=5025 RepID=A0A8H3UHJ8_VENIN|nr:hypothetical protein EG327_010542 [Venturia inaequalis]